MLIRVYEAEKRTSGERLADLLLRPRPEPRHVVVVGHAKDVVGAWLAGHWPEARAVVHTHAPVSTATSASIVRLTR